MTAEERRELLDAIARLAIGEAETDDVRRTFLPTYVHRLALRHEIVVVLGARGVGKSAMSRLLVESGFSVTLTPVFGDALPEDAFWFDAFSQSGPNHPGAPELDWLAGRSSDEELRAFWIEHLIVAFLRGFMLQVSDESAGKGNATFAEYAAQHLPTSFFEAMSKLQALLDERASKPPAALSLDQLPQLTKALDQLESMAAGKAMTFVAVYDQFELLGAFDVDIRRRFIRALLAAWLSLSSRYKHIRAKIFLGEDLFDSRWLNFPDASKLRPRAETIRWDVPSLYRAVVRHFAVTGEPMRRWLREVPGLELHDRGEFGWMPGEMPDEVQLAFIERLTGRMMGTGIDKAYTHRWIPNQLQDGKGRIMPRMMLSLLGNAARIAVEGADREELLTPQDLRNALLTASERRVWEVRSEYPWIDVLETLRGLDTPFARQDFLQRIGGVMDLPPNTLPRDEEKVLDELLQLGVLRIDHEGRIDVPDIYRYFYGIRRTGRAAHAA